MRATIVASLGCLFLGLWAALACRAGQFDVALPGSARPERVVRPLHAPLLIEPLMVTGSLGEFRNSGFHYGLDFSTGGKTGVPVLAVEDGVVRRLMYSRYGIGYGIWLEHADGRQSKYGHLESIAPRILNQPALAEVREKIQLREEFRLEIDNDEIFIRRGEAIAASGESGAGFAHLQ